MEDDEIISFIKDQPRSIQEVAKFVGKSWVGTDNHLQRIKDKTCLINIKTFRKGSHGALKVVYYTSPDAPAGEELKRNLYEMIKRGRKKEDFDFLEVYQFVPDEHKKAFFEHYKKESESINQQLFSLFQSTNRTILCFSGNLSFVNIFENGKSILEELEDVLKRKISVKIITRVNMATMENINKLQYLLGKYGPFIELRHAYQPLRGFIFDESCARFKNEELTEQYKEGELQKNTRIFYEIYDEAWTAWLQKVFWNIFRTSIDYKTRLKEIKNIF